MTEHPGQILDHIMAQADFEQASEVARTSLSRAYGGTAYHRPVNDMTGAAKMHLRKLHDWLDIVPPGDERWRCRHIPEVSGVMFWSPARLQLMCPACWMGYTQEIAGTPEDYTCDSCGVVYPASVTQRQENITLTGGRGVSSGLFYPPTMVMYSVCNACEDKGL